MNTFITSDPNMYRFASNIIGQVQSYYRTKGRETNQLPKVSFRGEQRNEMYINIK